MCHFGEGMGSAESTEVLSVMVTKAWHGISITCYLLFSPSLSLCTETRHMDPDVCGLHLFPIPGAL